MGRAGRFNRWLAIRITGAVGTMWCAYVFAVLALVSLPDAVRGGRPALISWIAQTFLQLVLLSVIIVGQNIQSTKQGDVEAAVADHRRATEAHLGALERLHAKLDAHHAEHMEALRRQPPDV